MADVKFCNKVAKYLDEFENMKVRIANGELVETHEGMRGIGKSSFIVELSNVTGRTILTREYEHKKLLESMGAKKVDFIDHHHNVGKRYPNGVLVDEKIDTGTLELGKSFKNVMFGGYLAGFIPEKTVKMKVIKEHEFKDPFAIAVLREGLKMNKDFEDLSDEEKQDVYKVKNFIRTFVGGDNLIFPKIDILGARVVFYETDTLEDSTERILKSVIHDEYGNVDFVVVKEIKGGL